MKICIYQIRNILNNKIYIGSTKNLRKRKIRHLRDLNKSCHHCIYLQRAYNKYGVENFVFEVLEECDNNDLFTKEKEWIDKLKPEYNIGAVGGGDNYSNHPNKGIFYERLCKQLRECDKPKPKFREDNPNWKGGKTFFTCPKCNKEVRTSGHRNQETCSDCKDISGERNPFFGKSHSEETKKRISEKRKGLPNISCSKRCTIEGTEYPSASQAAREIGIKQATLIYRLKSKNEKFKNWYYL